MKLAILSSEYPPYHWGGVGSAAHTLANRLAERGHEVHVFTRRHSFPPVWNHEGVVIHMVRWLKLPMAFALSFGKNAVPEVNREGGFDAAVIFGNMTLLRERDYETLKFPCVTKMCGTWAGERSTLRLGEISLTSVSGINDLAVLTISSRYDKYEDLALLRSDAVVVECDSEIRALNERMRHALRQESRTGLGTGSTSHSRPRTTPAGEFRDGGAPEEETRPPPGGSEDNGAGVCGILDRVLVREGFLGARGNVFKQVQLTDMELFSPSLRDEGLRARYVGSDGRLLLFVGRLAARKNVMEAARIFEAHSKRHPKDKILFIGKGNQEARLRRFIRRCGLEGRMHIVSGLGFRELAVHYASADAFLFPSLWEGFGLVLLEALASGLPVVSRPVGGAPEVVIEGRNGFLYDTEEGAVEALEKCELLDRKWIVEDVQTRYSLKRCIDVMEAIVKRVAAEGKTRSAPTK
ncbi:MAG: glycosyltransferase [Thermoplasmata archaeon]